ncbi:MAG: beta-lactamase family protein [Rhodothermales bacterium]|nr:beta-lactamase family protein [Rhodothermales bacterium]MBO6781207.1 beta-lactamase family protein [Rhodothermales bacterium]
MQRRARFVLLAVLLCAPPALAQSSAELERVLSAALDETGVPGLRAAIRLPDGRVVTGAVGVADKQTGQPLDDLIGMPGGSTGKTFVAALTMLLVEDGTLSLRDHASKWIGDRDWFDRLPNADEIRIHHLLSHSSGIGDYPATMRFNMAMVSRAVRSGSAYFEPEELIRFGLDRKPYHEPGDGYVYTDIGYLLLGLIIEQASGDEYYTLLEERILDPHGLSRVRAQRESVLQDIATGYSGRGSTIKKDGRMKFDPRSEWTGGGLVTTPTMLVEFMAALGEGRIVSPDSFRRMVELGWQNPEHPAFHYGLGLFVDNHGETLSHGGLWPGFRSHMVYDVPTGIAVAIQTNRDNRVDLEGLSARVAEVASAEMAARIRAAM